MKALLVIAHGSRRQQSNEEVKVISEKLKSKCGEQYPIIHPAFLELAEPLIPDGIKNCVDDGATDIIILPYFLNSGRHVVEDIPEIVNETITKYPNVKVKLAKHLGASDLMMDVLISTANNSTA